MSCLTSEQLRGHQVPAGCVTLWWLGQSGFVFKSPGGKLVAIDPYLSNSCKAFGDAHWFDFDRLVGSRRRSAPALTPPAGASQHVFPASVLLG